MRFVRNFYHAYLVLLLAVLLVSLDVRSTHAQERINPPVPPAPPVVPQTPPDRGTAPNVVEPERGRETAPAGAEQAYFVLIDVRVDGEFSEVAAATRRQVEPHLGARMSVAEFYDLAARIQNAYFRKGFPLARVVVPPQELKQDGSIVRLLVVDGYIESIDAQSLPEAVRKPVLRALKPIVGKRHLKQRDLVFHTLIAGDTAGLSLASAIAPGTKEGGAKLILSGTFSPVHALFNVDNSLAESLGKEQVTMGITGNSPFDQGETLALRYSAHPSDYFSSDNTRRYIDATAYFPFGSRGMSVMLNYAKSETNSDDDIEVHSEFTRALARVTMPVVRQRQTNLYAWASFEAVDQEQTLINFFPGAVLGDDRLRVLRTGIEAARATPTWGLNKATARLSQGISGLGARKQSDASLERPLSRAEAEPSFTSIHASVDNTYQFHPRLETFVSLSGQSSLGDALLTSEQLVLGGQGQLSTFDSGAIAGDSGLVLRAEVRSPIDVVGGDIAATFKPYLFGAAGEVTLEEPTIEESHATQAASYGVGVTMRLVGPEGWAIDRNGRSYVDAHIEWGEQYVKGDGNGDSRFSFGLTAHF